MIAAIQTQPPVFRVGTHLVQVNVVVHDKHGDPITTLKKEDFTVLERGKPQQVALFSITALHPPHPRRRCRPTSSPTLWRHGGASRRA
jgi:VWFA-related protein